jgi:hypothetical protein
VSLLAQGVLALLTKLVSLWLLLLSAIFRYEWGTVSKIKVNGLVHSVTASVGT